MRFYFTNPTNDRLKGREVQLRIEKETGLILINPFYGVDGTPTKEIAALDRGERPDVSEGEIIHNDLKLIKDNDGLVAFITNKSSWGSISETFYAHYDLGKPTYIIFDTESRGTCFHCRTSNPNNPAHPWPKGNSTKIFGTLEGFIEFAKTRYPKETK